MLRLVAWTLLTSKSQAWGHACDTGGGEALSILAAGALLGRSGAGRARAQPPSTAVAGLTPALPSGGVVKGDEGTVWAGLVPSRVDGAGGISAPGVPVGSRPGQGTGGQRDPGDKYPSGGFVLPGRTGTEGHSCCGCHRAPTASREEMGAARAPTSHPGG